MYPLLVMFILALASRGASAQLGIYPKYVAALLGVPIELNCSTASQQQVSLTYGGTVFYTYIPPNVVSALEQETFTVNGDHTVGEYQTIVKNFTQATCSQYACQAAPNGGAALTTTAEVIGLNHLAVSNSAVNGSTLTDGQTLNLTCSVTYYQTPDPSLQLKPLLNWTDSDGNVLGDQPDVIYNSQNTMATLTMSINVTGENDDLPFYCTLHFAPPTPTDDLTYTDNASAIYLVNHGVSYVNTTIPLNGDVIVGDVINCTSNGRPAADITWLNLDGSQASPTFELDVTQQMSVENGGVVTYTCRATNSVPGLEPNPFVVEENFTFTAVSKEIILQSAGVEAWVIAVAVVVPVVVITAVAIGGYFFWRHRKRSKTAKAAKAAGNSAANSTAYSAVQTSDPNSATAYSTRSNAAYSGGNAGGPGRDSPGGYGDLGTGGVRYYTGSNNALNTSVTENQAAPVTYPYVPRTGTGPSVSMNPNPGTRTVPLPPPGNPGTGGYPYTGPNRPPSVVSSTASNGSTYRGGNAAAPPGPPTQRSGHASLAGSEV